MLRRLTFLAVLAAALTGGARAQTACPEHYLAGAPPALTNPRLERQTRELCYIGFAVLHSGVTRTPLYAAERLTGQAVRAAREQVRVDQFRAEERLPRGERAELTDYQRSGLDRGHLAASGNGATPQAQAHTFTLANIVPQDPENNRGVWAGIEGAVRDMAARSGELYVITGPLFEGATLRQLRGRVLVPSGMFKLVFEPRSGRAAAYVAPNDASGSYETVTLAQLEARAGMRLLPAIDRAGERPVLRLPAPRPPRSGAQASRASHTREPSQVLEAQLRALSRHVLRSN